MSDAGLAHIIPGAPSPTEIIKAAIQLKKIYDAFCHKHRAAARQVTELAGLVNTFAINLANQGSILERAGRFFPNEDRFRETIAECDDFLHDYEVLFLNRPNRVRKAWHTVRWSFEDEQKRLLDKLNAHNQAMNSFSLNVLLGIALHDAEAMRGSTTVRPTKLALTAANDSTLLRFERLYEHLYEQVVLFQNHQKRSVALPAIGNGLDDILKEWRDILIESGLPEDKVPRLPEVTGQRAMTSAAADYFRRATAVEDRQSGGRLAPPDWLGLADDRVLLGSKIRGSVPGFSLDFVNPFDASGIVAREPISPTTEIEPRRQSSSSALSPPPSPVFSLHYPSPTPTAASSNAPDPIALDRRRSSTSTMSATDATMIHDAVLKLGSEPGSRAVKLSSYKVGTDGRGRVLVCNIGLPSQVEHKLPSGSSGLPFTKHSSVASHPHEVSFLTSHEIRYGGKTYDEVPRYIFDSDDASRAFQSALRRRKLVSTHEVNSVRTSTSPKAGEALDQHLKLWKSNSSDERYYLCYYVNNDMRCLHREFPVLWFDKPAADKLSKKDASLKLEFTTAGRTECEPVSRRLSRTLSFGKSSRTASIVSVNGATVAMDGRHRRASVLSNASGHSTGDQHGAAMAADTPSKEALKLAYLDVTFSSDQDRQSFLDVFRRVHDESWHTVNGPPATTGLP